MAEKRKIRIGRLVTLGEVAAELGRLYREARRGGVPVVDASRLATILAALRECLKASDTERRVVELEALLAAENSDGVVVPFRQRGSA
jgi:ribosomal protein L13E